MRSAPAPLAEVVSACPTVRIPTPAGPYDLRYYPFGEFGTELPAALVTEIVDGLSQGVEALGPAGLIVCPEPGGNQWGVAVGYRTGLDVVVLRQRPAGEGARRIARRTAFYEGDLYAPPLPAGVPVVVIDDVISSGGTLDAILGHLAAGGVAVTGVQTIVARGPGFRRVAARHGVAVRSLVVDDAATIPAAAGHGRA